MLGRLIQTAGWFLRQLHIYRHTLFVALFLAIALGPLAAASSAQMDIPGPIGPTWDTQQVDNRDFNLGRGLCLDAQGHPHIAYGGSHLYYAWYDGISWRQETVDDTLGVGGNASLALDAAGNPHIAYNGLGSIKYAHWTGSEWQILTLDSNSASPSLVLDNAGHPHIAYEKGYTLGYAHRTGSGWDIQTTDLGGGNSPVLALDSADNPHLIYGYSDAYQTDWEGGLRYAHWTGSAWQMHIIERITDIYISLEPLSLVVDQANNPHIYYGRENHLTGARWTGAAWEITDLQLAGIGFSLTWDAQGFLHVIYAESNPFSGECQLWYAHWTGSVWITELVSNDDYVLLTSLALDAGGNPHVALFTLSRDLKHLHRVSGSWITQYLDSANNPGGDVYLVLDSQDHPHISYLDTYHSTLTHAYLSGQHWTFQPIVQVSNAEYSFTLDHADNPHIAYGDFTGTSTGGQLKYIWWTGSSWASTPVVDALDSIYSTVFLAVDTARQPHIAYITSDEIRYAHWVNNTWSVQTIETVGDAVPLKPDLALDALNRPHIVYADDDNPASFDAKYAYWTGSSWITQTVAEDSYYPSLELDTDGNPHIAYAKRDGVYYATWTGSTWITQTVASVRFPNGVSLALDGDNHPHISYFDYDPRALKYAYWTGHTWVIQTLDSFSVLSLHPSLGLDSITRPFIVYFKEGYSPYPGGIKLAIGSWPGGYNFEPNYNRAAKPEEQVTYVHLLQNTGPVSDTYTLTHYSSQSWSTVTGTVHGDTFTLPNSIALSPGQTALITVTGTISSSDSSKGFLDMTIVMATSTVSPTLIRRVIDVTLVPTHESYLPIMLAKN